MKTWTGRSLPLVIALSLAAGVVAMAQTDPAATNPPPAAAPASAAPTPAPSSPEAAASNQVDQAALTREMLRSIQRDIASQVAQHTAAITSSLAQIEPALNRIRQQQADSSASANRTILIAAGLFAIAGFFGLGFLTLASVRAMGRFTDVAVHASRQALPPSTAVANPPPPSAVVSAPPPSDPAFKPAVSGTVEQASARFQGALEQLERRIKELEHSSHPSSPAASSAPAISGPSAPANGIGHGNGHANANGKVQSDDASTNLVHTLAADTAAAYAAQAVETVPPASQVAVQLGKGQALMNLEQVNEALECFNNALAEDPDNTDALLRKGMALEKLQDWERALECYDRAIRLDSSLTVAYLYKGGVCNRLDRHREALDSYEHALRTERHRPVGS